MCRTEGDGRVHPAELLAIQAAARSSDGLLEEAPDGAVRGDDAEDSERSSEAQGDPQGAQWLAAVHHDVHPAAEQQQQAQVGECDIDYRGDPERAGVAAVIVCCDANQHGPYTTPKLGQTLHYVKFLPTARARHSMPEGCDSWQIAWHTPQWREAAYVGDQLLRGWFNGIPTLRRILAHACPCCSPCLCYRRPSPPFPRR